jgi:hypothetical protein
VVNFSSSFVKAALSWLGILQVKTSWLSFPSWSYSPRSSDPKARFPSFITEVTDNAVGAAVVLIFCKP